MHKLIDFAGRVAIVTGAGCGLGKSYALELARRGASVVVNDLRGAQATVDDIRAVGGSAEASLESVATLSGGKAIVETALNVFGRLDILISNAGILRHARFEEMSEQDFDDVVAVHLKGAFNVGQPAFQVMKRQGYGRILMTASASGLFGHPWQAGYAAAKAGLLGLANVIALEGKDSGVLCNVILPNARTDMANQVDFAWRAEANETASALQALLALPVGGEDRLEPGWVTPLATYLVSEACNETHGAWSACSGRYARVAVGLGSGWVAKEKPSVECVAEQWQQIAELSDWHEPQSVYDEALAVRRVLPSR